MKFQAHISPIIGVFYAICGCDSTRGRHWLKWMACQFMTTHKCPNMYGPQTSRSYTFDSVGVIQPRWEVTRPPVVGHFFALFICFFFYSPGSQEQRMSQTPLQNLSLVGETRRRWCQNMERGSRLGFPFFLSLCSNLSLILILVATAVHFNRDVTLIISCALDVLMCVCLFNGLFVYVRFYSRIWNWNTSDGQYHNAI